MKNSVVSRQSSVVSLRKIRIFLFLLLSILTIDYRLSTIDLFAVDRPSSGELIVNAWHAHGIKDKQHYEETLKVTQQLIDLYKDEADKTQASLRDFPKGKEAIEAVSILNDVATAYFIQGECFRDQVKNEEAIKAFKVVLAQYCYAQAWDPRGWYWKVAKAAK